MNIPLKIISGGQTGIDRLGLEVAFSLQVPTGGVAPKDFWTENGSDFSLKDFGLIEDITREYPSRTRKNIVHSDGTVIFGDMSSSGSKLTVSNCIRYNKPYITNPTVPLLIKFIGDNHISILNIAGNRGSKLSTQELSFYRSILEKTFKSLIEIV